MAERNIVFDGGVMKTKAELRQKHGTPDEFKKACQRACLDGCITPDEMYAAIEEYRVEYATATDDEEVEA